MRTLGRVRGQTFGAPILQMQDAGRPPVRTLIRHGFAVPPSPWEGEGFENMKGPPWVRGRTFGAPILQMQDAGRSPVRTSIRHGFAVPPSPWEGEGFENMKGPPAHAGGPFMFLRKERGRIEIVWLSS